MDEELKTLMPRINAANETLPINSANLRQYFGEKENMSKQKNGKTVRKDEQGFEDIDEFWAEEEDDSKSLRSLTSADETDLSVNSSFLSATDPSELDNQAGADKSSFVVAQELSVDADMSVHEEAVKSNNETVEMVISDLTVRSLDPLSEQRSSVHTELISIGPKKGISKKSRLSVSYEDGLMPGMSESKASGQIMPVINTPSNSSKNFKANDRASNQMTSETSPFFADEDPVTPGSNASDKEVNSIRLYSEMGSSPVLKVNLFGGTDKLANENESSTDKPRKQRTSVKKSRTKKQRPRYKDSPTSPDGSLEQVHTDEDSTFRFDGDETDKDASFIVDKLKNGVLDLSHADAVLKDRYLANEANGMRRSTRKRFKPLAWYKGEHYIFERRQSGVGCVIPTVVGIERAGTRTPDKDEKTTQKTSSRTKKTRSKRNIKSFSRDKLPKDLEFQNDEWAELFDHNAQCINRMNIICRANEIEHRQLPNANKDSIVGFAGQTFNLETSAPYSRWISGRLILPPGASKEAESVGEAVQIFNVQYTQPDALEVAYTCPLTDNDNAKNDSFDTSKTTRFLLGPGDEFYIPTKNAYYLKNHSDTVEAELRFLILRPNTTRTEPKQIQNKLSKSSKKRKPSELDDAEKENRR